ncbi:MAG TPA: heavy metal-responsive transcriptional regulator [Pyrinomonadaceae bacterium]|nr:heavy metal-responsive transcriptional regulator [Pyrinomonadaceae bacterium]
MKREAATKEARPARLKIGEASKMSGVGIEALRFYERSGLLGRPARTESGYRLYTEEVLDRLAFIKRAQVLGFSLDEIKQIIAEREAGQSPCVHVREVVRRRLAELDERMREMRLYRKELAEALAEWEQQGDAEGHICGLIEKTEIHHADTRTQGVARRKR